jgi:predicted acylesterase/phospholipase RssA
MRFKRNNSLSEILPRPVAFVFSGGTSLGAVQVGMLMGVFESNIVPDLLVGTSVGAINAASVKARLKAEGARLTASGNEVISSRSLLLRLR